MRSVPALAFLMVAAAVAGCIGGDEGDDDAGTVVGCDPSLLDQPGVKIVEPAYDPLEGMAPENAFDFETTNVRTCSLPAIGWSALSPDGKPHKYIGEIDMRGDLDLGAVAVLGNGEPSKVYLVDISDRAEPAVLSVIEQQNVYIVDVKISDDGALLFTASQTLPTSPEFEGLEQLEGPTGFTVYDISDPASPRWLVTQPDPQFGCHMLSHEIIGGGDALFCVSQQVRAYQLVREAGTVTVAGFIDYVPEQNDVPLPSGIPLVGDPTGQLLTSGPHDMTVQMDAETGQTLAIVSHWGSGVRVVDFSSPPLFEELGAWAGEGATHYHGNVHSAMMFYAEGKRYIAASPEYTFDGAVPAMWVLDASDLSDLKLVAEWFHPGEHESQRLFLTTHQWQVAPTGNEVNASDVRIYLTMNHGGVWVLEFGRILAGDDQAAILGYNLARMEVDTDVAESLPNAMLATWDVNVVDGYVYGSDRATGLWVFHYAEDTLGDSRLTGFA